MGKYPAERAASADGQPEADLSEDTLLGKRYADEAVGIEVLCTKAGTGTLASTG